MRHLALRQTDLPERPLMPQTGRLSVRERAGLGVSSAGAGELVGTSQCVGYPDWPTRAPDEKTIRVVLDRLDQRTLARRFSASGRSRRRTGAPRSASVRG
jgi:hypothetical protein